VDTPHGYDHDLVVIGSGPAGQKAAIQAAKLGKNVVVVDRPWWVGGVCTKTGTIPSKTLREAALYLTGMTQRSLYGVGYRVKDEITIDDLFWRTQEVIKRETDVVHHQLARNRVTLLTGSARFEDPHTLVVEGAGREERRLTAEHVVVAVGTKPARPRTVEFDNDTIIDSDGILDLKRIPGSMVVVGGGVIGIEYASTFAALGTKVTVIELRERLLDFCDLQIVEALQYHMRDLGVSFRFREKVTAVERFERGTITTLESGKRILADVVLFAAGRQGATDDLGLEHAGLTADERGRIDVDPCFRTAVPHIYAVGDVVGFPALAATSMEQGRLAACHAFGVTAKTMTDLVPIGIYAIPEISFVGKTEENLTASAVPYEIGVARHRELARSKILGDEVGLLKILVHAEERTLLGVHVFGAGATELVHIGQAMMGCGATVDFLVETVFNYPTLAEAYKVAALDAMNKLHAIRHVAARNGGTPRAARARTSRKAA
jgi:NAD(P) transhydrogenase